MNILVISNNYPTRQNPSYGAFVYNLMQEFGREHNITIISPLKLNDCLLPKQATYGNELCEVKRPLYISFSNKNIGGLNTSKISQYFFCKAIHKELKNLKQKPDVIYTHFISNSISVIDYALENDIPVVVASGESTYDSFEKRSDSIKIKLIENLAHIVCVSKENKKQLIDLGFQGSKISVIPNAVDYSRFKPLDKNICKANLGLPQDKFIVGFIGHFIHRKGPNRIVEAINTLNDNDIRLVCVGGKGELNSNDFTTVLPPVPNMQLPEIYNAFDVFVLPTLHEGSCNVIEEAKACCLPIISSMGTSVEEQIINGTTGVLLDPMNIDEIAFEISKMKNDLNYREQFTFNLKKKSGENSLGNRANIILNVIKECVYGDPRYKL